MRVCIIFRGDNVRETYNDRNYINILMSWENINLAIIKDLINNGHSCDIAFITYYSAIIEEIKNKFKPKYMILNERFNQILNFKNILSFMHEHKNEYDRFIILRCDLRYRLRITKWPKWQEKGIILENRDVHWPKSKLCADLIFIVDVPELELFSDAIENNSNSNDLHEVSQYLYNHSFPFHFMYDGYYHMDNHPLHTLASIEQENPDLDNPLQIESITDISQWN